MPPFHRIIPHLHTFIFHSFHFSCYFHSQPFPTNNHHHLIKSSLPNYHMLNTPVHYREQSCGMPSPLEAHSFSFNINNSKFRMESNARFLNIKSSRFKDDHKGGQTLTDIPSMRASCKVPHYPEQIQLQSRSKDEQIPKAIKIGRFLQRQHGAHHPVAYRASFRFKEKWQTASKHTQSTISSFLHITDQFRWTNFALFPFLVVQIWFVSVFRVFNYDSGGWMFALGLTLQLLCLTHKLAVLAGELDPKGDIIHQLITLFNRQRLLYMSGNLYSVCYYSIAISSQTIEISEDIYLLLLDLVLIAYKYVVLEEIYSMIRIELIGSRYKLFMNLFDLASNVFIMIHVFAVLLFLCTFYSPSDNWHTISPINAPNIWISDYVESFYFACTTMLTVGFGDIRPTNLVQVLCILMVQLVGILNNAYVINEIGANLSQIHERRNTLQKDISNAQKLIKFNHIGKEGRSRMLDNLVKNQLVNEELSISDEEALLDKLSQEFKVQIKENSQLRAVRKNFFMLANFSRRFQYEISKRLIKAIYPPHAVLPNHAGRERIYIITKGAVDILTEKKYKNRIFAEKIIKSIQVNEEVDNNHINAIYGYASLFSGKLSRIKAVSKNFTVCYYLENQDVLECMMKSNEDFERYFEIKHKVELLELPEKYELPNITSNREHYSPNIFFLIRKNKKHKHSSSRKTHFRAQRRLAKVFEKFQEETGLNSTSYNESTDSFPSEHFTERHRKPTNPSNFSPLILNNVNSPYISKPRNIQNRESNKQYQEIRRLKLQEKMQSELNLETFCENYKEYKNYYPKGNLSHIIQKCNYRKHHPQPQVEAETFSSSRLALLKCKRKRGVTSSSD